jgi:chitodextrinase
MGKYLEAAQKIRAVMDTAAGMLTDEQALKVIALYPLWDAAKTYAVGDRVRYAGNLYRCLTAHTAQAAWTPTDAHSLWAKVLTDPSGEILPWVQPDSTNPYAKGDKVTHNGKTWESLVDNNVWEPGAVGTESLWKEVAA